MNQSEETASLEVSDLLDETFVLNSTSYFPIRELSLKTGVNSVTLRAWERRYGLLKPKRTKKGHRLYDQDDVRRVEGILRWIQQGVAVSKVRALLDQGAMVDGAMPSNEWLEWQESLVTASQGFQEDKVERLYQQVFSQYPAEIAVRDWLLPSFEQLGKGAPLAFCESIMLSCLMARTNSLKSQQKHSSNVLITGLMSQRVLWCYMAAAMLLDKGIVCRVVPNIQQSDDWSVLVEGVEVQSVLVFCDNELAPKTSELILQMQQWNKPVAAIGAGFWLAAHELGMTVQGDVKVYSEALEGVTEFMKMNRYKKLSD